MFIKLNKIRPEAVIIPVSESAENNLMKLCTLYFNPYHAEFHK